MEFNYQAVIFPKLQLDFLINNFYLIPFLSFANPTKTIRITPNGLIYLINNENFIEKS